MQKHLRYARALCPTALCPSLWQCCHNSPSFADVSKPEGPLLHANVQHQDLQDPSVGLLFLLQLIGPDCLLSQKELPQHLTKALENMLDTARPESISLLNFSSPNGELPEPGHASLESMGLSGTTQEEGAKIPASWTQSPLPVLADEQPHHLPRHSVLRKLLQGMNSHEPALMFLYGADPRHELSAVHLQLSDLIASGKLGDAVRASGIKLSDLHLVAFEPLFEDHPHFGLAGWSLLLHVLSLSHSIHCNFMSSTCATIHIIALYCKRFFFTASVAHIITATRCEYRNAEPR